MLNVFRLLGDLAHLVSIFILLVKMRMNSSSTGISFKSQACYFLVYCTRYLDLLWTFYWPSMLYLTVMKLFFLASSGYTMYLMLRKYQPTVDPAHDTFKVEYLLGFAAVMALLFPYSYRITEVLWAFSIWLESVAILPQLLLLQRVGSAENITAHYIFALGSYRVLYCFNWIVRYFSVERHWEPLSVSAGILQSVLYSDFFWIYYTKVLQGKKFALPV